MTQAQLHQLMAVQAQIATHQARIAYWQSFLASGAYKDMNITKRAEDSNSPTWDVQLSDAEKRDTVLGTIHNLIDRLEDLQQFHFNAMREARN